MNELTKVFNYSGNEIRTVVKDGEVWFVAKDVCDILEIKNVSDAVARLKTSHKTTIGLTDTGSNYKTSALAVNEPGLYKLIFKSRKEEAEKFSDWVAEEVLPTIRKHGAYMTDEVLEKTLHDPDYMIGLLTALKDEKVKRMKAESTVNILSHVNKTYTATEIAKELGFKSAIALNKDLSRRKIQYQQKGTWVLFSKFADKGYVEIKQEVLDNGKVIYHRRFTQLGREWLLNLFEQKTA